MSATSISKIGEIIGNGAKFLTDFAIDREDGGDDGVSDAVDQEVDDPVASLSLLILLLLAEFTVDALLQKAEGLKMHVNVSKRL
jgi:hypothetical protein